MLSKPLHCSSCPLYGNGIGFSTSEGMGKNGVLILGEALGRNEALDAKPFRAYAESGSVLEAALSRLGLNRKDFLLYNMISCQPPFNKLEGTSYEYDAIENCSKYVKDLIKKYKPKIILALGNVALKHSWRDYNLLTEKIYNAGFDKPQIRSYLKKLSVTSLRGYVLPSIHGIPLIASLHPSFIRRTGMVYLGVLMRDIRLALLHLEGKTPKFSTENYKVNPSEGELQIFLDFLHKNPNIPLAYDIETPFTTLETDEKDVDYRHIPIRDIDSIQFSAKAGEAIFLTLGKDKNLNRNWFWAKEILATKNPKVGFNNWEFDDTNIKYHFGEEFPNGFNIDEMWMSKWWNQDYGSSKLNSHGLSLQWTTSLLQEGIPAWKHTSFDDPFIYGNVDADITLRNFQVLKAELEKRKLENDCFVSKEHPNGKPVTNVKTLYQGFVDDIVKLNPILKAASRRGFPISVVELEKYKKKIKAKIARVYDELQSKYPKKLLRRNPLKGYKNVPKEVIEIKNVFNLIGSMQPDSRLYLPIKCDISNDNNNVVDSKDLFGTIVESLTRKDDGESGLVMRSFLLDSGVTQKRWCRLEDFKVNSKPQVLAYLEYKGYKLKKKKNKATHKMEFTTSKDIITQLYEETHDELLGNIVYLRELQKLLSTYLGEGRKKSEWQIQNIDMDGIGTVHTTFGYWPVSGQLSSKNPNIQNQPKYGSQWSSEGYRELAKEFRKIIKARRGKCLIEFDYKSYHALTTAFEAEDSDYMRLVRLDIHSYFAAHIIRSGFPIQKQKLTGKLLFAKKEEKEKTLAKIAEMDATLEYISDLDEWLKYDDEKLKEKLRWVKDNYEFIRNRMAKPTILGIPYGMGAKRLYEENIRSFENVEQARTLLALIHKLFPKINIWQSRIRQLADRKGYLISRYGYLQRFYNIYDYRPLKEKRREYFDETIFLSKRDNRWWSKRNGTDSEKVVSFYPQNNAFGKIKEAIRECDEVGYLEKYGFCNTIHDSLLFECDLELKDECIRNVKEIMERPAKYLVNKTAENGLVCSVDISVGNSWGSLQEIKI